jgi:hypothetical protein
MKIFQNIQSSMFLNALLTYKHISIDSENEYDNKKEKNA